MQSPPPSASESPAANSLYDTTQRMPYAAAGPLDDEIMVAYRHCRDRFPLELPTWIAGIQNATGEIYRMVILDGLAQADCFADMLRRMGYRQVDGDMKRTTSALDAVFVWG